MDVARQLDQCDLVARIASTREEWTAAFELVYQQFLRRGYVSPHPSGIVYREAMGLEDSRTIVAVRSSSEEVVGTLTIVGDNPLGFDVEASFPREVDDLRAQGRRLAEVTALAISPLTDLPARATFFHLARLMFFHADWNGYDDMLLVVNPRHLRVYQHLFGAQMLGMCRSHGPASSHPGVVYRIDIDLAKRNFQSQLRGWFALLLGKAGHFFQPPMSPEDHAFFCRRRGIRPRLSAIPQRAMALPAAA